jgi:hypothetical protein
MPQEVPSLLLLEQDAVVPPQEPTQLQLLVQTPSAVSKKVPVTQELVVVPQEPFTGVLLVQA